MKRPKPWWGLVMNVESLAIDVAVWRESAGDREYREVCLPLCAVDRPEMLTTGCWLRIDPSLTRATIVTKGPRSIRREVQRYLVDFAARLGLP
jgi:hypothetical protein